MKKRLIGLMFSALIFGACGGGDGTTTTTVTTTNKPQDPIAILKEQVLSLPYQDIDSQELDSIAFVREEEKFARDIYQYLGEVHSLQIFTKIAQSEQRHMDAVKILIDKYNLNDPVEQTGDAQGVFVNEELNQLYQDFTSRGASSLEEAVKIGGWIEEMDIVDLTNRINSTDNEDIKLVFDNLRRGSANHLRAFSQEYEKITGQKYIPQILCPEDYEYIVTNCLPGNDEPV